MNPRPRDAHSCHTIPVGLNQESAIVVTIITVCIEDGMVAH
jgi:hypothetical protein